MKCTDCGTTVIPVVACDVDGTISEYHRSIAEFCWKYWGMDGRAHMFDSWDGQGNYEDWIGITQTQYREAKLAFRQGGYKRYATPMPGLEQLRKILWGLRIDQSVEVWITTTRPWNRLDSVDPDTRFWLDQYFPVYDHILYGETKYKDLAQIVSPGRVVAVLEDLPDQYVAAQQAFGMVVPILINRPHNKFEQIPRYDLIEAAVTIHNRVKEWWRVANT